MRDSGVREVLVYCRDHRCSHSATISADRWPNIRLSDVEPDFTCTACGRRGGRSGRSYHYWVRAIRHTMTTIRKVPLSTIGGRCGLDIRM
jgi:hypothetical protein